MPTNVEIKARVADPADLAARLAALGTTPADVLVQHDTFFACPRGRLKLREVSSASAGATDAGATGARSAGTGSKRAELIWYDRPDTPGSKCSEYHITPVADAESLRRTLGSALGATHVVAKTRRLYLVGQTRIHLDTVVGLGTFVELEVVLHDGQTADEGHAIAAEWMARLGIAPTDLLAGAYADMLPARFPTDDHA